MSIYKLAKTQEQLIGHPDYVTFEVANRVLNSQAEWIPMGGSSSGDIRRWESNTGVVVGVNLVNWSLFITSISGQQIYTSMSDVAKFQFKNYVAPKVNGKKGTVVKATR